MGSDKEPGHSRSRDRHTVHTHWGNHPGRSLVSRAMIISSRSAYLTRALHPPKSMCRAFARFKRKTAIEKDQSPNKIPTCLKLVINSPFGCRARSRCRRDIKRDYASMLIGWWSRFETRTMQHISDIQLTPSIESTARPEDGEQSSTCSAGSEECESTRNPGTGHLPIKNPYAVHYLIPQSPAPIS